MILPACFYASVRQTREVNATLSSNEGLSSQPYSVWKNKGIGRPPAREELVLTFREIRRALMSFTVEFGKGGTKLDPDQAIVINNKIVPNLDLPRNKRSKSLEYVEQRDIDITNLLRTSASGERNIFEVNYLLSAFDVAATAIPNKSIGKLTLEVKVFYPGTIILPPPPPPGTIFCMICGKGNIPVGSVVCPFCRESLVHTGTNVKECRNCGKKLPTTARFCEKCGTPQPGGDEKRTKVCANCKRILSVEAKFCDVCATPQPSQPGVPGIGQEKIICKRCGASNEPDAAVCSTCSAQLTRD